MIIALIGHKNALKHLNIFSNFYKLFLLFKLSLIMLTSQSSAVWGISIIIIYLSYNDGYRIFVNQKIHIFVSWYSRCMVDLIGPMIFSVCNSTLLIRMIINQPLSQLTHLYYRILIIGNYL